MNELTGERLARNLEVFRAANERIAAAAEQIGVEPGRLPFICECSDPSCTQVLLLDLSEYEAIRGDDRRFVHAPGHGGT